MRKSYRFSKVLAWAGCALFGLSFASCFGLAVGGVGWAVSLFSALAVIGFGLMIVGGIAALIAKSSDRGPKE